MENIKYSNLLIGFYLSLLIVLPLGLFAMIWWCKRVLNKFTKHTEKNQAIYLSAISPKVFVYMLPGLLILGVFSIPLCYFECLLSRYYQQ